jgi:predicted amidophosphoribosyltransferase
MSVLTAVLDLVLPQPCAGCGAPDGLVCPGCEFRLAGPARLCLPSPAPRGLPPPFAIAPYAGAVRQLIVAHKERGLTGLAGPLGAALARAAIAASTTTGATTGATSVPAPVPGSPILLIPVPSSRASVRRRGQDPTLRIAREAAKRAAREPGGQHTRGLAGSTAASCVRALGHQRRVADQAGLSAADRATNLSGALRARQDLRGLRVIVVDDVITTGATLAEAARALRAAGAEVPAAALIAATERRTAAPFSGDPADGRAGRTSSWFRR